MKSDSLQNWSCLVLIYCFVVEIPSSHFNDKMNPSTDQASNSGLSFHPSEVGIISQIQKLMAFDSQGIVANLYKLNIYPPAGHFKAHVDTPKGAKMIGKGSLIERL